MCAEASIPVVAVGHKVQSEPVLVADDGRGNVAARQPEGKMERTLVRTGTGIRTLQACASLEKMGLRLSSIPGPAPSGIRRVGPGLNKYLEIKVQVGIRFDQLMVKMKYKNK